MFYWCSFNPFVSCSVFFICSLQFAVYKSFTSLIMFIPKYFIVFNVMVSRTAFLTSLSGSLFLAYQSASDFCMFVLYFATLLNLFISSNRFFFLITISFNNCFDFGVFYIWYLFFFFCLICLARTSSPMLNKSGESGHPCVIPDLTVKISVFHHWVWCKPCTCHIRPLLCWGTFTQYSLWWQFLSWVNVEFYQMLFLHLLRWSYDF